MWYFSKSGSSANFFKTCALALGLAASAVAFAADSGSSTPAPPTVAERLDVARAAIKVKDWKKAMAELNQAAKNDPKNADVQNLLGYSNRKQAQPNLPQAFVHYKRALELDPAHKGAHEYIGEAYLMDKKPDEAEKHLATLEKLCGNKTCEEYADLSKSIAEYRAKNKS